MSIIKRGTVLAELRSSTHFLNYVATSVKTQRQEETGYNLNTGSRRLLFLFNPKTVNF